MALKEIVVFDDIEIGGGTITDDFIADNVLSEVIEDIAKSDNEIDLIFNGDTFDFLKCPVIRKKKNVYPESITSEISSEKINLIYRTHKKIFVAMRHFLKRKNNKIYFIYGNHDYDLLFPEIQQKLRKFLDANNNVFFQMSYFKNEVYAEHGQQFDTYMKIPQRAIKLRKKANVLNIPLLIAGFPKFFIPLKENHPFVERITQRKLLMKAFAPFRKSVSKITAKFLFYNVFTLFKFLYKRNAAYILSALKQVIKNIIQRDYGDFDIRIFFKNGESIKKNAKVIFFGHIHTYFNAIINNKRIILLDTWRDEYVFESTEHISPKPKMYARVLFNGKKKKLTLVKFVPKAKKIKFSKVVEDEYKKIKEIKEKSKKSSLRDYHIVKETFLI